jgi:hypothetical protein
MAPMPPIAASASRRTSMHPPAAAAVDRRGLQIHAGGYSRKKKKTKAGIRARSAVVRQLSRAMYDTRS